MTRSIVERLRRTVPVGEQLCRNPRTTVNPDGPEAADTIEELYEALERAAAKFREYARLHANKLNDRLPDAEFNAIMRKSDRNREMAESCEAALRKARGEQ